MADKKNDSKVSGHLGLVLLPDVVTRREIVRVGGNPWNQTIERGRRLRAEAIDSASIHFTLYHCDGMQNVEPERVLDEFRRAVFETPWSMSDRMFMLRDVRLHKGKYLLWHASVSERVRQAHLKALEVLVPYVSPKYLERAAEHEKELHPQIRDRDLELVRTYGRRNVARLNQPHFLCGTTTESAVYPSQRHRGCFTDLALTKHRSDGVIEQILIQVPLG